MRLFDILLHLGLVLCPLWPSLTELQALWKVTTNGMSPPLWLRVESGPALVCLAVPLLHRVAVVRWRWQIGPALAGWILAGAGWTVCPAVLGVIGVILCVLVPLPDVGAGAVMGPFSVGFFDYDKRGGGLPSIGRIFYPTSKTLYRHYIAPYLFNTDERLARQLLAFGAPGKIRRWIPFFALDHMAAATVPMAHGAQPFNSSSVLDDKGNVGQDSAQKRMPVVLVSHGLGGCREISTALCLSLASHGCVVVAVEHTDGSCALGRRLDGTLVRFDPSVGLIEEEKGKVAYEAARRRQVEVRLRDAYGALALLKDLDAGLYAADTKLSLPPGRRTPVCHTLRGALDLGGVVAVGHSFGGCTALSLAAARDEWPVALRGEHIGKGLGNADYATSNVGLEDTTGPDTTPATRSVAGDGTNSTLRDRGGSGGPEIGFPVGKLVSIRACVSLDPAVGWIPRRLWSHLNGDQPISRTSPFAGLPLLTVVSKHWHDEGWAYRPMCRAASAGGDGQSASTRVCVLSGLGHQSLCDSPLLMPPVLHSLAKEGQPKNIDPIDQVRSTNTVVLAFLAGINVIHYGTRDKDLSREPLASCPRVTRLFKPPAAKGD